MSGVTLSKELIITLLICWEGESYHFTIRTVECNILSLNRCWSRCCSLRRLEHTKPRDVVVRDGCEGLVYYATLLVTLDHATSIHASNLSKHLHLFWGEVILRGTNRLTTDTTITLHVHHARLSLTTKVFKELHTIVAYHICGDNILTLRQHGRYIITNL